jgi:hypothetical protein
MTDSAARPDLDELDSLPTEELRERAFGLARERRDVRFFWSVFEHLPHADDAEAQESDLGSIGATVEDAIGLWREFSGRGYGENEPLLRAAFIDYLRRH